MGYQKLTIPANGYALLANPFVQIGTGSSTPEGYAINDMFTDDTENSTAANTAGAADQLQVWDRGRQGYANYFFSARVTTGAAWAATATPRVAADVTFDLGDGFWYLNRAAEAYSLTVRGEISTEDVEVTIAPGFTLVCNPFPSDLPLNSEGIDWGTAGATAGNTASAGDQIQIWDIDRQGYSNYFFSSRVTGGAAWATTAAPRVATTDVIPAGQGFWYLNRGEAFTITLKSPLSSTED